MQCIYLDPHVVIWFRKGYSGARAAFNPSKWHMLSYANVKDGHSLVGIFSSLAYNQLIKIKKTCDGDSDLLQ